VEAAIQLANPRDCGVDKSASINVLASAPASASHHVGWMIPFAAATGNTPGDLDGF